MLRYIRKSEKGISLTEVFAVLILLGILATVVALLFFRQRDRRSLEICRMNSDSIRKVIDLYRTEAHSDQSLQLVRGMGTLEVGVKKAMSVYFQNSMFPECPAEGQYFIDNMGNMHCSVHPEILIQLDLPEIKEKDPLEELRKRMPKQEIKTLSESETVYQNGNRLFNEKKYLEAAEAFCNAYELDNSKVQCLYNAANAYFRADSYELARKVLKPVLKEDKAKKLLAAIEKYEFLKSRVMPLNSDFTLIDMLHAGNAKNIYLHDLLGKNEKLLLGPLEFCQTCIPEKNPVMYYSSGDMINSINLKDFSTREVFNNGGIPVYSINQLGSRLLFLSPKFSDRLQLVLLNLSTGVAQGLSPEKHSVRQAFFESEKGGIYYLADEKIYFYDPASGKIRVYFENVIYQIQDFCMYPDRGKILFTSNVRNSRNRYLYELKLDGKSRAQELAGSPSQDVFYPSFSPDGKLLSHVCAEDGIQNLMLRNMETGETLKITDYSDSDRSFLPGTVFIPDSDIIYYSYGDPGAHDVYVCDTKNRKQNRIIEKSRDITILGLAPGRSR